MTWASERKYARFKFEYVIDFSEFPRAEPGVGCRVSYTKNISADGLCFENDAPIPTGTLLRFQLYAPGFNDLHSGHLGIRECLREDPLVLLGKVIRNHTIMPNQRFEVGIAIYKDIGDQQTLASALAAEPIGASDEACPEQRTAASS